MNYKTVAGLMAAILAGSAFARDAQFEDAPYMNPKLSAEARCADHISALAVNLKTFVTQVW